MELQAYFNAKAEHWDKLLTEEVMSRLKEFVQRLGIKRGAKVLDVGTGTGVLIPFLAEAAGPSGKVTAMDFAVEMLAVARQKYPWPQVQFLEAGVTAIPLPAESFDEVICNSAFPHFNDQPQSAREMYRVVKTDGRVAVFHPHSRDYINELHKSLGGAVGNDLLPDDEIMRAIFTAAGFKDITIEDVPGRYLLTAWKI